MLEYGRIDISEGIDVNKTNLSKECDICHYWYFKDIGFKYEPYLCNGLIILLLYMLREVLTEFIFWYMSKDDAVNIMNGFNLVDKRGVL